MATPSTPAFLKPSETDSEAKLSARDSDTAPEKTPKKFPRWILLVASVVLLAAVAAGCAWFLRYRAKMHNGKTLSGSKVSVSTAATKSAPAAPPVDLSLDPFVVNLADAGGHSYARIGLTLEVIEPAATVEKSEKKVAAAGDLSDSRDMLRDTIIGVLNQEQAADLLAPGGKEHLKDAIRAAVAARNPRMKISDIFFTEFLIQQ